MKNVSVIYVNHYRLMHIYQYIMVILDFTAPINIFVSKFEIYIRQLMLSGNKYSNVGNFFKTNNGMEHNV